MALPGAALLPLVLWTCATIQEPPGGPPDFAPPVLLSVTPDSGAEVPGFRDPVMIRFNEVISERPGAMLEQMVIVSPRPSALSVSWRREEIAIRPREGWRPGLPYRVTLLPGITDLRGNRLLEGRTTVFSTGGAIPATAVTGRVLDWETAGLGARALVELTRETDSLVFWDVADSLGRFTLSAVPAGAYVLYATLDRNNNRRRDYREPFDSSLATLDSTLSRTLWTFVHDSVGPRLRTASRTDSLTVRLEFNQSLAPDQAARSQVTVRSLPDSAPVALAAILTPAGHDSARAAARLAADSGTGAPADSARPAAPTPPPTVPPPLAGGRLAAPPPDSIATRLLAERPRLSPTLMVRLAVPLVPGNRYLISATAANPSGATTESSTVLVVPATPPAPADTTPRPPPAPRPLSPPGPGG